jgi:DNA-directed RNA polymerase subunit RPC12/RpoP
MSIVVSCQCGKQFKVKDEFAGKKGKCPSCGNRFIVPTPAAKPAEPEGFPDWDALGELESTGSVQAETPAPPPVRQTSTERAPAPQQAKRKACPSCGSMISSFALICEHCGTNLKTGSKAAKASPRSGGGGGVDFSEMSGLDWVIAILCSGIGVIVGILRIIRGRPSGVPLLIVSISVAVAGAVIRIVLASMLPHH